MCPTESLLVSRSRIHSFRSAVTLTHVLILFGLTGLYFCPRAAVAHEPVRG